MYNDTHMHTTNTIILLCEANRGGARPFITLFCIERERMLCSTYWNVDKNVYICSQKEIYFSWHTKDSKKNLCSVCMFKGENDSNEEALLYSKYSRVSLMQFTFY
jgi:hypothetical protein